MSLGTTYGFSISAAPSTDSGTGTPASIGWASQTFTSTIVTSPPVLYTSFALTYVPVNPSSLWVWYDGQLLHPDDWVYEDIGTGPIVRILFAMDPALSANGIENVIYVQYAYEL